MTSANIGYIGQTKKDVLAACTIFAQPEMIFALTEKGEKTMKRKNYIQIQPIELKPCPFCGNEKIVTMYNRTSGDAVVKCENCRAEVRVDSTDIHSCFPSFDETIERITAACDKWNNRI